MFIQARMVEKDKQIDNSIKFKQLAKAPVFNQLTKNADFALLRNCVFPLAEGAKALHCNQAKKTRHKPRLRKKNIS